MVISWQCRQGQWFEGKVQDKIIELYSGESSDFSDWLPEYVSWSTAK